MNPTRATTASTETRGHPAPAVRDGNLKTYWSSDAEDEAPYVELSFRPPVRLLFVRVWPGASTTDLTAFLATGRPHRMTITLFRSDGTSSKESFTLEDKMGKTEVNVATSDVKRVRLTIDSSYAGDVTDGTAITDIEFARRKD